MTEKRSLNDLFKIFRIVKAALDKVNLMGIGDRFSEGQALNYPLMHTPPGERLIDRDKWFFFAWEQMQ